MLINFCNSTKQLISAISVQGSVITLYFNPRYNPPHKVGVEVYAFGNYLHKFFNIKKTPRADDPYHDGNYHLESSHLTNLFHFHFDFDDVLDQNTVSQLINATTNYQDKDKPLRKEHEETALINMKSAPWNPILLIKSVIDFTLANIGFPQPTQAISLNLPLISARNLNRLEMEFQMHLKNKANSSSHTIINYLNTTSAEQHFLPQFSIPTTQALINGTCPQINTQASEQDTRTLASNIAFDVTFGGAMLLGFGLWFRHEMQKIRPVAVSTAYRILSCKPMPLID